MTRDEIAEALAALGGRCPVDAEIVVVGGAAAILCGWIERGTADVDVGASEPKLSQLAGAIASVAGDLDLSERWINDGAKAFAPVLPQGFRGRLAELGRWGRLSVRVVARRDFILLKLYAMRAEDVLDLREIGPTEEELEFVRGELPRIARLDARRAHLMELYLEQGGRG
jgi:hypothetical protein